MAPIRATVIIGAPTTGLVLGVWPPPKGSKILIILDLRSKKAKMLRRLRI